MEHNYLRSNAYPQVGCEWKRRVLLTLCQSQIRLRMQKNYDPNARKKDDLHIDHDQHHE